MRERHLRTTLKLRTNSFCRKRAGLEVLIKMTSKADRWKESKKKLYKKLISYCIFFNNVTFIKAFNHALFLRTKRVCSQLRGCRNSFLSAQSGVRSFDKTDFKRWKESEKSLTKN